VKPLFLDCPPRYTRTQRAQADDIGYACSVIGVQRKGGYSRAWWVAMILIALATGWAVTL